MIKSRKCPLPCKSGHFGPELQADDRRDARVLLSQTSKYALRAAILLAERGGTDPVRVGEIAEALDAPRNYLSKILHLLARAGVLESERGPRGGFRLAVPPEELSLVRIVGPVDPGLLERRCLLGRSHCTDTDPCPVHDRWRELAEGIASFLHETTVADLLGREGAMDLAAQSVGKSRESVWKS